MGLGVGVQSALELSGSPQLLLQRPWTLLTYGLVHTSWRHLFYNELVLVVAILLWRGGAKEFYILFASGLLLGALLFLLLPTAEVLALSGASVGVGLLLVVALCRSTLQRWVLLLLLLLIVGVEVSSGVESLQNRETMLLHLSSYLAGGLYALLSPFVWRIRSRREPIGVEEARAQGGDPRHAEVLKKVRQSGYASLSEEEKRVLNE